MVFDWAIVFVTETACILKMSRSQLITTAYIRRETTSGVYFSSVTFPDSPTILDISNGTLRPSLLLKSRIENGKFFPSRDFIIDFEG